SRIHRVAPRRRGTIADDQAPARFRQTSLNLKFYMDEHVPQAITDGLRLHDVDVLTVQEDERSGLTDPMLMDRSTELDRLLFTQDPDFLIEANRRQRGGIQFSGIIFERHMSLSI